MAAIGIFFQGWHGAFPARGWRAALLALVMALWSLPVLRPAFAAELVMFERTGCVWCVRWEREIGPIYPKTEEGRLAPLRHVSLDRGPPRDMALAEPVFYTPTFVLMDEGREIGRITGYIGEDAFWGLLGKMVGRIGGKPAGEPVPKKAILNSTNTPVPAFADLKRSDE